MATKAQTAGKKGRKKRPILTSDPPIIVGGGGSTNILILKTANPTITDPPPGFPKYFCIHIDQDIDDVDVDDGKGHHSKPPNKVNPKDFMTVFAAP